jgi:hypothetical protein
MVNRFWSPIMDASELRPDATAQRPARGADAAGAIRWPVEQGDPLADWPTNLALLPPGTASRLIDEDRDDER